MFETRSHFISRWNMIVSVNVVLNSDWPFDNLCARYLSSESKWVVTRQFIVLNSEIKSRARIFFFNFLSQQGALIRRGRFFHFSNVGLKVTFFCKLELTWKKKHKVCVVALKVLFPLRPPFVLVMNSCHSTSTTYVRCCFWGREGLGMLTRKGTYLMFLVSRGANSN